MEHDDKIPGVSFSVDDATLLPPPPKKGAAKGQEHAVALGRVVLRATVNDLNVWKEAVDKLRNLRIYTVEDLATEMIEISQERAKRAEETLAKVIQEKDAEIAKLKQQVSFNMAFAAHRHVEEMAASIPEVRKLVDDFIRDCDRLLDEQKPR
jgi:hypothetical protein